MSLSKQSKHLDLVPKALPPSQLASTVVTVQHHQFLSSSGDCNERTISGDVSNRTDDSYLSTNDALSQKTEHSSYFRPSNHLSYNTNHLSDNTRQLTDNNSQCRKSSEDQAIGIVYNESMNVTKRYRPISEQKLISDDVDYFQADKINDTDDQALNQAFADRRNLQKLDVSLLVNNNSVYLQPCTKENKIPSKRSKVP